MLPILTTADDVGGIVGYLKNKPMGATVPEIRGPLEAVADGRKLAAYAMWQIVMKDGERIKLAPRGWELARKAKTEEQVFREILDSLPPYRSVLEWVYHQKMNEVTNVDVAAFWHEHHSTATGTENENTIKDQAVCFFRVCEAAKLGKMVVGRRGQPTRLVLDRNQLEAYVEAGPSEPPWVDPSEAITSSGSAEPVSAEEVRAADTAVTPLQEKSTDRAERVDMRVFISHGKNTALVEQVETLLGLADIPSEVAVKEETAAIPVPDKVFAAMRRCTAAIIVVSVDEGRRDAENNYTINENVLIEIGAAFVLYDKKVVLVWDRRLKVPSNLQGLYRCEFEGDDLNWSAGMKLMKAIKGFKA